MDAAAAVYVGIPGRLARATVTSSGLGEATVVSLRAMRSAGNDEGMNAVYSSIMLMKISNTKKHVSATKHGRPGAQTEYLRQAEGRSWESANVFA